MNYQFLYKLIISKKNRSATTGFSLIETSIALVTLAICLAYAMPLFLYAKINNSKSEIRTGALIVAQRVFDNVRSQPINLMPRDDGSLATNLTSCVNLSLSYAGCASNNTPSNPVFTPTNAQIASANANGTLIKQAIALNTFAMGRPYQTVVTYCGGITSDATVCTDKYRKFKV